MKWVLIIYFFIGGPDGGWFESKKQYWTYYESKEQCIEYAEWFNALPKPGSLTARCKQK